jgi:ABC-type spermidine/putrescine transport system permease subunit II
VDPAVSPGARRALAVVFAAVLAFLYVPFVIAAVVSVRSDPLGLGGGSLTLAWYRSVLANDDLRQAVLAGAGVAGSVALIDVVVATCLSLALTQPRPPGPPWFRIGVGVLSLVPLAIPSSAYAAAMYVASSGPGGKIPFGLDLVIEAHAAMFLPFAMLLIYPAIRGVSRDLIETAEDLGASRLMVFVRVILPLIAPVVVGAAAIVFIFSFNEPVVPEWLADQQPTFASWLWGLAKLSGNAPATSAIGTLAFGGAMLVALVLRGTLVRRLRRV